MSWLPGYQGIDLQRRLMLDRYIQSLQPKYPAWRYAPPSNIAYAGMQLAPLRADLVDFLQEQVVTISAIQQANFRENLAAYLQADGLSVVELAAKLKIPAQIVEEHLRGASFVESTARKIAGFFHTSLEALLAEPRLFFSEQIYKITAEQQKNFKANLATRIRDARLEPKDLAKKLKIPTEVLEEHLAGISYVEAVAKKVASHFQVELNKLLEAPERVEQEKALSLPNTPASPAFYNGVESLAALSSRSMARELPLPNTPLSPGFCDGVESLAALTSRALAQVEEGLPSSAAQMLANVQPLQEDVREIEPSFSEDSLSSDGLYSDKEADSISDDESAYVSKPSPPAHKKTPKKAGTFAKEKKTLSNTVLKTAQVEPMQLNTSGEEVSFFDLVAEDSSSSEESEYIPQPLPAARKKVARRVDTIAKEKVALSPTLPESFQAVSTQDNESEEASSLFEFDPEDSTGQEYEPSDQEVSRDNEASRVVEEKTLSPTVIKKAPTKNKKVHRLTLTSKEDARLYGKNFRILRDKVYKVGRETMATKLGCKDSTIIRIENGTCLKSRLFSVIERVCGLPVKKMLSKTFEKDINKNPPLKLDFSDDEEEKKVVPLSKLSGKPQAQEKREKSTTFSEQQAIRLGKSFKWLREYHKLEESIVALQINCKPKRYSRLEVGYYTRSRFYHVLQNFYRVPFAELLSDTFEQDMKAKVPPPIGPLDPLVEKRQKEGLQKDLLIVIGSNIGRLLNHNEVSQLRFAEVIETDRSVFRRAVKGKYINPALKEKIAKAFKVSVADLESDELEKKILSGKVRKIDFSTPYIAKRKAYSEGKEFREIVSKNFKALLAKEEMEVADVTRALKIPRGVLWNHYNGVGCNFDVVDKIAGHFGKTREEMLDPNLAESL